FLCLIYSSTYITFVFFFLLIPPPPLSTLFPYTTLFRSTICAPTADETAKSPQGRSLGCRATGAICRHRGGSTSRSTRRGACRSRSEEHTSELQSPCNLVCRLLLEKKKKNKKNTKYACNK